MATKTATKSPGLQYSDAVAAQGGSAVNRQTGAVTTASGYTAPRVSHSSGGEYGFEGGSRSGNALPSSGDPAVSAPTPTTLPLQEAQLAPIQQPERPMPGTTTPQEALANAKASGIAAPQEGGEARLAMQKFQPQQAATFYQPSPDSDNVYDAQGNLLSFDQYKARGGRGVLGQPFPDVQKGLPNTSGIENQLAQDPLYTNLLQTYQEFNDTAFQRKSLTQEYDSLSKKLGINALNTELMNMKNVIEGTEDDLRAEVTKAGGFATESQVMALTNARNKQLIKNYNNLLETKQMAMETLNTMIGLAAQDRQFAMQAISQKLQIEGQIIEYRDKMKTNAQNQLNKIAELYGYSALQTGDPWQDALTEKTLGLGPGGLAQLSGMKTLEEQRFEQQFGLQLAQFGLQQDQFELEQQKFGFERDKALWEMSQPGKLDTQVVDIGNGRKALVDMQSGETIRELDQGETLATPQQQAQAKGNIDLIANLIGDKNLGSSVGPNALARFSLTNRFTGGKSNFIAGIEQLRSQLNLDTLVKAKAAGATFGALSDQELRVLANAASKIGTWAIKDKNGNVTGYNASEKDFKTELDKIANFAKQDFILKGGNPAEVGAQIMPDGAVWTPDSRGQMTKLTSSAPGASIYPSNFTGPTFNRAGTAPSANQVKGMQQRLAPLPLLNMDGSSKTPNVPLTKAYPAGSQGGQCGVWVRSIVNKMGLNYPAVGDYLAEKAATVKKYGVPQSQAKVGTVVLTTENKTNGHVALIIGRNDKGWILGESNYGLDGKVKYGRTIPFNSPYILGYINPK